MQTPGNHRAYLRSLSARKCSTESIRTARSVLGQLARHVGKDLPQATAAELASWQADMADHVSARTLRTKMVWVRGYYAWAVEVGALEHDPSWLLRTPKVPRLLPRPLSEQRLELAIEASDRRMRVVILLAAFAGLRAGEVAALAWSDVQLEGAEPTLRVVGKGARERIVDMAPMLCDSLASLPHRRGPVVRRASGSAQPYSANGLSKLANRYLRALDVPDTYHALRHRFGTQVCRAGGIRVAQASLGHASITTAALYAEVSRRDLRPVVISVGQVMAS